MGLQLFNFVYNTLLGKANDNTPDNSLFLPRALAGMTGADGQPYLPIEANNWSLDNIGGGQDIANNLATAWFNAYWTQLYNLSTATPNPPAVTAQMIADAQAAVTAISGPHLSAQPYPNAGPDLDILQIDIAGLANVVINGAAPQVTSSATGYSAQITLDFNAYPATGASWNAQLALAGTQAGIDSNNQQKFLGLAFTLAQPLAFVARRSTTPVAPPPTLHLAPSSGHPDGFDCQAGGIALLEVGQAELVAQTTVTVSADGKNLQISLQKLTLQGTNGGTPTFTLQNLQWLTMAPTLSSDFSGFYDIWTTFYKNLLATPEAAALLATNINTALNDGGNISQVESLLDAQLASAFDSIFGSTQVAGSTVDPDTNAVDKYLFNRARAALNDPASYVFVPAQVLGSNAPVLEPYTAVDLTIAGPYSTSIAGQALTVSQIVLASLAITGLSNLVAPADNIVFGVNQQATANLLLGKLNPGPTVTVRGQPKTVPSPPATASTPFSLNVQVGSNTPIPLSGTLNLTLQNTSGTLGVNTALTATGDTPDQLELNYSAITLVAADADVTVAVTLDGGSGPLYSGFVTSVLNQSQAKEAIVSALNGYIGGNLGDISAAATTFARNTLNNLGS